MEIFGRREHYQFPEPFGLGAVVCHDHEKVTTLPRLLPRVVRDAFIAECGRRNLPITRTDVVTVN